MRDSYVWVFVSVVVVAWGYWLGARHQRELAALNLDAAIDQQKKISLEEGRARGYEEGFAECKSVIESMIWDETFDRVFRAVRPSGLPSGKAVEETIEEAREASKCALADWQNKFARAVAKRREGGLLTDGLT